MPRTEGTDVGLWLTPNAMDSLPARDEEALRKQYESNRSGRTTHSTLREQVAYPPPSMMWPTPSACPRGAHTGKISGSVSEDGKSRVSANGTKWGATLQTAVKMWPTPTQRDGKGGYKGGRIRNGKISKDTLDVAVQHTDNQGKQSGSLNPTWVEWLMGYPTGHTALRDWATPSSRKSRRKSLNA